MHPTKPRKVPGREGGGQEGPEDREKGQAAQPQSGCRDSQRALLQTQPAGKDRSATAGPFQALDGGKGPAGPGQGHRASCRGCRPTSPARKHLRGGKGQDLVVYRTPASVEPGPSHWGEGPQH